MAPPLALPMPRLYSVTMLLIEDLLVIRGDRILFEGLSFSLAPGATLLLRGRNGAGKSTLLRTLAGLRPPDAGRVTWNGEDIFADRESHAIRVGWLSHLDAVKPGLTVAENLAFAARVHGGSPLMALDRMNLGGLADLPARMLSAGQKRRLALARAMLGDRPLWLFDEPANGLDAASTGRLRDAMAAHCARGGMVIAATHVDFALPGAAVLHLEAQ